MAVSPADFYAYSQATGTPVPQDKRSQALLAPAVFQWRKSQVQRRENQGSAVDTAGKVALGAGVLAGGGFGARRLVQALRSSPQTAQKVADTVTDEAAVRKAASGIDTRSRAATVDLSKVDDPWGTNIPSGVESGKKDFQTLWDEGDYQGSLKRAREQDNLEDLGKTVNPRTGRIDLPDEEVTSPTLVTKQESLEPQIANQSLDASQSAADQLDQGVETVIQRDTDSIKAGKAQVLLEQQVREVTEGRPSKAQAGHAGGTPIKDNSVTSVGKEVQAERYEVGPSAAETALKFNAQDLATRPGISQQELTERILASAGGGTKNASPEIQQMLLNPNLSLDTIVDEGLQGEKPITLRNFLETKPQETRGRSILNPTYEPAGGPTASMTEVPKDINAAAGTGEFLEDFVGDNLGREARSGVEGTGGPLTETLAYTEKTNKSTTRVPGLVSEAEAEAGDSLRQERLLDEVVPTRTQGGEQSTGIIITDDPKQPLKLQGASTRNPKTGGLQTDDINVEGSKYIGNFEGQVETPYFMVGKQPDILKKDASGNLVKTFTGGDISIEIGEQGQMRPVVSRPGQESRTIYDLQPTYDYKGNLQSPGASEELKLSGRYQSGSDQVGLQPYMMNELVTGSNKKTYKVSDTQGSYGQLMRQTGVDSKGKPILTPTSVSRNDMIQRIQAIEKGWTDPSTRLNYMQQNDPNSSIKPYHKTGYIAQELDKQLQSEGINLPVLRDVRTGASNRFITDLTNTTLDTEVYGRPASRSGFVSKEDYKKPKVVVEGVTKQRKGLGGIHPMDMVDDLENRGTPGYRFGNQKTDVAFHSPRIEMAPRQDTRPSDLPARGKELWDVGIETPPRVASQDSIDNLNLKVDNLANSLLNQSAKSARRAGKRRGR